jgi:hypothetical protein
MGKYDWFDNIWEIKHIRNGKVIWEDIQRNSLVQEGEESILESFFRNTGGFTPTEFYVRLCNDNLVITDTLTTIINEPVGNGYEGQLLERSTVGFPTKELDAGAYRLVSKLIEFTAVAGDIGPVTTAFLSTTENNSGKLIAFRALAMTRTILDGDSMTIQFRLKLS